MYLASPPSTLLICYSEETNYQMLAPTHVQFIMHVAIQRSFRILNIYKYYKLAECLLFL